MHTFALKHIKDCTLHPHLPKRFQSFHILVVAALMKLAFYLSRMWSNVCVTRRWAAERNFYCAIITQPHKYFATMPLHLPSGPRSAGRSCFYSFCFKRNTARVSWLFWRLPSERLIDIIHFSGAAVGELPGWVCTSSERRNLNFCYLKCFKATYFRAL